jgi:hypothetical protein
VLVFGQHLSIRDAETSFAIEGVLTDGEVEAEVLQLAGYLVGRAVLRPADLGVAVKVAPEGNQAFALVF